MLHPPTTNLLRQCKLSTRGVLRPRKRGRALAHLAPVVHVVEATQSLFGGYIGALRFDPPPPLQVRLVLEHAGDTDRYRHLFTHRSLRLELELLRLTKESITVREENKGERVIIARRPALSQSETCRAEPGVTGDTRDRFNLGTYLTAVRTLRTQKTLNTRHRSFARREAAKRLSTDVAAFKSLPGSISTPQNPVTRKQNLGVS